MEIPKKYDVARVLADHLTPKRMYVEGDTDECKPMGDVKSIGCGAYHCMVYTYCMYVLLNVYNYR